ncbi:unnamed protein product, partial [Prorocentrum cordatum]
VESSVAGVAELAWILGQDPEQAFKEAEARERAWATRKADSDPAEHRPKKIQRLSSFHWMARVDKQIEWSTGTGLSQFQYDKPIPARGDPWTWKRLAISPDRESSGVCALNAMKHRLHLNAWVCFDWSHDCHNDFDLALDAAGLHYFLMTFVLVANVPCADWNSGAKWQQVKATMDSYFASGDPHASPMFQKIAPRILESLPDAGVITSMKDPLMEVWNRTAAACPWHKKDAKLEVSRFLGPLQRVKADLRHAPLYELAYTVTCLHMDLLHGKKFLEVHFSGLSPTVESAGGATTSKKMAAEEKTLRASCKNPLVLAMVFWSDPGNIKRLGIISQVGNELLRWQSQQVTDLREFGKVPKFLFMQCSGMFCDSLAKMFNALSSEAFGQITSP